MFWRDALCFNVVRCVLMWCVVFWRDALCFDVMRCDMSCVVKRVAF